MWPSYVVVDKAISEELFERLKKLTFTVLESGAISTESSQSILRMRIYTDQSTKVELEKVSSQTSILDVGLFEDIARQLAPTLLRHLLERFPFKRYLLNHINVQLMIQPPNYVYPSHYDDARKLASGVLYIYPQASVGTILDRFDATGNNLEIEWRPNRFLVFCRQERVTAHSFRSNCHVRVTLVCNLMASNKVLPLLVEGEFRLVTIVILKAIKRLFFKLL